MVLLKKEIVFITTTFVILIIDNVFKDNGRMNRNSLFNIIIFSLLQAMAALYVAIQHSFLM